MLLNTAVLLPLSHYLMDLVSMPLVVFLLSWLATFLSGVRIHSWIVISAAMASVPLAFTVQILYKLNRDRRAAAALGAELARTWEGKWPGNIDILLIVMEEFKNGYPGQMERSKTLGHTFNMRFLWDDNILTSEPEHIKTILATDFSNYEKGPHFNAAFSSVLGTGVFNADGELWKFHRAMTRPFFHRDRISHFDLFDRHAEDAIEKIKHRIRDGYPIDFQDLISRFTLDSASEFLFGHCVQSLSNDLPYPHYVVTPAGSRRSNAAEDFSHAFAEAQYIVAARSRLRWAWPLFEIFKDRSKDGMAIVNAYLDPILEKAVERTKSSPQDQQNKDDIGEDETLLDHLLKYTSDPVLLRDEMLNILLAGRDTTAGTLTYTVYMLASHPQILARLRSEVLSQVGPVRRPTYDDIRDMKFLRAVINETLRLFPAVPFNVRTTIKATTWPSPDPNGKPIYIPEGTDTSYSVLMMQRRKDLWGPDAEEFDPDRFLDDRLKKYLVPNPFIFLPFNAGPRICLGQQFAYNEISFFLIRLLQNIESVTLDLDAQPPDSRVPEIWKQAEGRQSIEKCWPKLYLTLCVKGGLWVRMKEAGGT